MTQTATIVRSKAPYYRRRTSRNYRGCAENALFTGFSRSFYYRNIEILVSNSGLDRLGLT